jgi:hypothetical protein
MSEEIVKQAEAIVRKAFEDKSPQDIRHFITDFEEWMAAREDSSHEG